MVICAALKVEIHYSVVSEDFILPCHRHGDGYRFVESLQEPMSVIEEGFMISNGSFLNRRDALKHALECGQLSQTVRWDKEDHNIDELYSEDLY